MDKKKYGLFMATSIVIANMVGTGVFTSLGFQVLGTGTGFALIMLWMIGGVIAFCGAASYAELGAMMPRSGGEYHFLSRIFHPAFGFMSGWISFSIGFAAPIAAASMAFGGYLIGTFHLPAITAGMNTQMLCAAAMIIVLTFVHLAERSIGSAVQTFFTSAKVLAIFFLIAVGLFRGNTSGLSFAISGVALREMLTPAFAISLFFVTYSYSGWNAAAYIAGEIENPQRNIPRSLLIGTGAVIVMYVLLNLVMLLAVPIAHLAGKIEIGYIYADAVFGTDMGAVMGGIISFLLISTISSMIVAGPRVSQIMGDDIPIFGILGRKNGKDIPARAIILQSALSLIYVMTTTFQQMIVLIGFALNLYTFLTVVGLFVERRRHPDAVRPFRVPGYPFVPALFLLINVWILVYGFIYKPGESLAGIGISLVGLAIFYAERLRRRRRQKI